MSPWVEELLPLLQEMLGDSTSGWRRPVALATLGMLVENAGLCTGPSTGSKNLYRSGGNKSGMNGAHPYSRYPSLMDTLLSFLKTEHQASVRRECLRVLGLLGALDPHRHKMNVGAIKIQRDTGVALISATAAAGDHNTHRGDGTGLPNAPPGIPGVPTDHLDAAALVGMMNYSTLEDFYPACAVAALMRVIEDPALTTHHNEGVNAITFLFKSLGVKGVPYLGRVFFLGTVFSSNLGFWLPSSSITSGITWTRSWTS